LCSEQIVSIDGVSFTPYSEIGGELDSQIQSRVCPKGHPLLFTMAPPRSLKHIGLGAQFSCSSCNGSRDFRVDGAYHCEVCSDWVQCVKCEEIQSHVESTVSAAVPQAVDARSALLEQIKNRRQDLNVPAVPLGPPSATLRDLNVPAVPLGPPSATLLDSGSNGEIGNAVVEQILKRPFQARYVRVIVERWSGGIPALRFELYEEYIPAKVPPPFTVQESKEEVKEEKENPSTAVAISFADAVCYPEPLPLGEEPSKGWRASGVQNGMISASQLTASSFKAPGFGGNPDCSPSRARLGENAGKPPRAWQPSVNNNLQWLQVDLGCVRTISKLATQGSGFPDHRSWVEEYALGFVNPLPSPADDPMFDESWSPSSMDFIDYTGLFYV
jgi:hypothetical protein